MDPALTPGGSSGGAAAAARSRLRTDRARHRRRRLGPAAGIALRRRRADDLGRRHPQSVRLRRRLRPALRRHCSDGPHRGRRQGDLRGHRPVPIRAIRTRCPLLDVPPPASPRVALSRRLGLNVAVDPTSCTAFEAAVGAAARRRLAHRGCRHRLARRHQRAARSAPPIAARQRPAVRRTPSHATRTCSATTSPASIARGRIVRGTDVVARLPLRRCLRPLGRPVLHRVRLPADADHGLRVVGRSNRSIPK